jgi:glutathione S-transferase
MDLFDQRAVASEGSGQYGLSGDMKKTQYVLQLLGAPWCAETLKCILVAAEQGMEMNCGLIDTTSGEESSSEFLAVSEFGILPALKEADYFTFGSRAILDFVNARGLGYSLIPKNVQQAAEQDQWVELTRKQVGPLVNTLVEECLLKDAPDAAKVNQAKQSLVPLLDSLNAQLEGNRFIVGKNYTFADLHFTAHLHLLTLTDGASLINERSAIKSWLDSIKSKKSNCGQNLLAASLLPSTEDIKNKRLANVEIKDF